MLSMRVCYTTIFLALASAKLVACAPSGQRSGFTMVQQSHFDRLIELPDEQVREWQDHAQGEDRLLAQLALTLSAIDSHPGRNAHSEGAYLDLVEAVGAPRSRCGSRIDVGEEGQFQRRQVSCNADWNAILACVQRGMELGSNSDELRRDCVG